MRGRPRGSNVRTDLDAPAARFWWRMDPKGCLYWRHRPGGNRVPGRSGQPAGRVSLHGQAYRANRIAVLMATGAWPAAGRVLEDRGRVGGLGTGNQRTGRRKGDSHGLSRSRAVSEAAGAT